MVEPQASRFWQSALQSGLLNAAQLAACASQVPPDRRSPDAIDRRLGRQAIEAGFLTLWQAQQLLLGRLNFRFDRYLLLDQIGEGGMGRVYLAKDTRLGRNVALKVLSRERMNNPRALTRFHREAKVGAQLQHENLVRIYDEGEAAGNHYLVMEYIEGKTVGRLIHDHGPLPSPIAARLARQVALGLEHAQQKGMIHRDVNPMNILVDRDGTAKLTDLGLAIDLTDCEGNVTREGATVGTFDYIAPEQARHSRGVDTRADIYSLGCTIYHMITGTVPFPQPSLPEKLYAHQALEPAPPSSLVQGVPPDLEAVVRRMMSKKPEDRFQRPQAVVEALTPFESGPVPLALIETSPVPAGLPLGVTESARSNSDSGLTPNPGSVDPPTRLEGSDWQGLAIAKIDFGPEPRLSESLSEVRDRNGSSWRSWLWIGAGATLVLILIAALALRGAGRDSGQPLGPPIPGATQKTTSGKALATRTPVATRPPIAVRWLRDGSIEPEADFHEALRTAAGKPAEVVLANAEPLRFDQGRTIVVPGGVVIRAAEGTTPVLAVKLKGNAPFLRTRPGDRLVLSGLTFQVDTAALGAAPVALIEANGDLIADRCLFSTIGGNPMLRALICRGMKTTLTGCQVEGFDGPLAVEFNPGSQMSLDHCLIIRNRSDAAGHAWAVTAHQPVVGRPEKPPTLRLDRCTIDGYGFLAAGGFSPAGPLKVEVASTIVRGPALLMWPASGPTFGQALRWSGRDNRYALSSTHWVLTPPNGFDALDGGPTDLDSWSKATSAEPNTRAGAVAITGGDAPAAGPRRPADFVPTNATDAARGIDPTRVGPTTDVR